MNLTQSPFDREKNMSRENELAAWEAFFTTWTIKWHGEEAEGIKTKVTSVFETVASQRPELLSVLESAEDKKRLESDMQRPAVNKDKVRSPGQENGALWADDGRDCQIISLLICISPQADSACHLSSTSQTFSVQMDEKFRYWQWFWNYMGRD